MDITNATRKLSFGVLGLPVQRFMKPERSVEYNEQPGMRWHNR